VVLTVLLEKVLLNQPAALCDVCRIVPVQGAMQFVPPILRVIDTLASWNPH
jgi:hypothetical protein